MALSHPASFSDLRALDLVSGSIREFDAATITGVPVEPRMAWHAWVLIRCGRVGPRLIRLVKKPHKLTVTLL